MGIILFFLGVLTLIHLLMFLANYHDWTGVFFAVLTIVYTIITVFFWLWMRSGTVFSG